MLAVPASTESRGAIEWKAYVCLLIIAVGASLRIYQWAQGRSLWLDEAYLAVNILDRNFGELHRPLEFSQSAPWLFLLGSKAMVILWGPGEMVLRLIPLLASLLSLWLFWRLAIKCLDAWVVPVVMAIFTFAQQPFYYAQELKQYSLDILLCTVILWLATRLFEERRSPNRWLVWLALTGSIGIFAMHAMPFLLAGVGIVILWSLREGNLRVSYPRLMTVFGIWLCLFAVNYVIIIRPNYTEHVMRNYWAFSYPQPPWVKGGWRTWYAAINQFLFYLGHEGIFKVVFAALLIVGAGAAIRYRKEALLAGILAGGLYWIASLAGKAPFFGRLLLFLFPLLILVCGAGLGLVASKVRPVVGALVAILLLVSTAQSLPALLKNPGHHENIREPVRVLAEALEPSDKIYVSYWAQPGLRFYRHTLNLSNLTNPPVYFGSDFREFTDTIDREWAPRRVEPGITRTAVEIASLLPKNSKLWLLLNHLSPKQEEELFSELGLRSGITPVLFHRSSKSGLFYCSPQ